jgi:ubiquinone/menaquinone biosynthesis C-methylase UbiE
MTNDAELLEANRRHWDEVVPLHAASEFYDVASFKAGRSTLKPLELGEIGEVRGKNLLHLQCHFGMDTLSWAREGAVVTGVDFSSAAVQQARALATELGIDARFIESSVYDLPQVLDGTFDVVFTSYGVIGWLPDLKRWAEVIAHFVKPGGKFYIAEFHPMSWVLDDSPGVVEPRLHYPYFEGGPAIATTEGGTYADKQAELRNKTTYNYPHSLGGVVTSLIDAGLQIEFLHEHPFTSHGVGDLALKGDDGYWHLRSGEGLVPMMFSLRARKPA